MLRNSWAVGRALALLAVGAASQAHAASFSYELIDADGPPKIWGKSAADLDGDGRTDLLVGGHSRWRPGLYWYRNPDWQREAISTTAVVGTDIEVADIDGVGAAEIVATTDTDGIAGITLFTRGASGWEAARIVSGLKLHDLEVADLDGDGRADIVGRGQSEAGNELHIWLQRTGGSLTYGSVALPIENGDGLEVSDVDRDHRPDIVLPRHWLRNSGLLPDGTLDLTRRTYNVAAPANGVVVVGHIDHDDHLDIVVSPAHRAGSFGRLAWFKGPADPAAGAIWPEMPIDPGIEADHHSLALADIDGDGNGDIVTAMTELTTSPQVKIYYNTTGNGTFAPPQIVADVSSHNVQVFAVGDDPYPSLVGADYNQKGRTPVKLWRQALGSAAATRSWPAAATLLAGSWTSEPVDPADDWDDVICGMPPQAQPGLLVGLLRYLPFS